MARKLIVVTAAYGNDHVKALGWQSAVLPFIAGSGADGVEIRRELFSADELNRLAELAADIERRGLLVCYSAPEALFTADGSLNPRLADFLQEAQTLNALWLKLSLGRFTHQNDLDTLRDILRIAVIMGMGFTVPALSLETTLPGGAMQEAARLGLALSLFAGPLALLMHRPRRDGTVA